ncbi:hypothetical protein [Bradyrhizobium sp. AZCC 1708]|uniref:hypothetical protein n=1 Tax=Bradyrhizobium sp. AZCC 1708 TaxID=3117015 RepID=UPI002FF3BA99
MNAHFRTFDDSIVDIDLFDVIDPRIADKARRLHRVHKWVFFPKGWITEPDGSLLIFDGRLYPLCRKRPDGTVVVLPMIEFGHPPIFPLKKPRFLYGSIDHPCDDEETQQRLIGAVQRLGLEEEVYRRYDALHRALAARRRNFRRLLCRR